MRTNPGIEPDTEIDAEFWSFLDVLDAIEDSWRDQGKTELADAVATLSEKIRCWQQQNQV